MLPMVMTLIRGAVRLIKYTAMFITGLIGLLMLTNCTMLGLNYASLETDNKPAAYPVITATSTAEWEAAKPALKQQFQDVVYGPWPGGVPVELVSRETVQENYLGGRGTLEKLIVKIGAGDDTREFMIGLATPNAPNAPLIISQTFSGTCGVFSGELCGDGVPSGFVYSLATGIFGPYIMQAPLDQYLDAGYAYASYEAGDLVPDRAGTASAAMAQMDGGDALPTSAIMAWAYGFSAAIDVLEEDPKIDPARIAVLGHSRHGKAALVAGAFEPRIAAVLAHQSGYGGAASSRDTVGEGIDKMINGARVLPLVPKMPGYPHWFAPEFQEYTDRLDKIPIDQHQLIALNAPTPVFLGNGRRDVWSDPNSTYRMAEAADHVYELYGKDGFNQAGMQDYNPNADLAFFMRRGGHGVHQSDIDAFLAFLNAHFGMNADVAP